MSHDIEIFGQFDGERFMSEFRRRLALRSASDFEVVRDEMIAEVSNYIHIGKEWPDIIGDN